MTTSPKNVVVSPMLRSRAVVVLTGLSYLFVAFGFSYLDRQYRSFAFESALWSVWAVLGFGVGVLNVHRPSRTGQSVWLLMGPWVACCPCFRASPCTHSPAGFA